MCCLLVSGFLTEITQQIHSLRASGVMSSHFARATESEMRTFRKSGGTLCTAPGEIAFLLINFILLRYAVRDQKLEIHMDETAFTQSDFCHNFLPTILDLAASALHFAVYHGKSAWWRPTPRSTTSLSSPNPLHGGAETGHPAAHAPPHPLL